MICDDCRQRVSEDTVAGGDRPFPAFTVTGAIAGSLAAAVSGTLLVVPAAVVAGAALDAGRQCSVCGAEMGDDDEAYHLMEETDDGLGTRSYRSAAPRSAADSIPRPTRGGVGRSQGPSRPFGQPDLDDPFDAAEGVPENRHETRFVFDEVEGRLVQEEPQPADPFSGDAIPGEPEGDPETDAFSVAEDRADGFLSEPETDLEGFWGEADGGADWPLEPVAPPEPPMEDLEP